MFKKILILITGLLIGIGIFFFREAGNLLSWSEILQPADAILVVGGGGPERIAKSIELYHADMASLLIISGWSLDKEHSSEAETMAFQAIKYNVEETDIVIESNSHDTYENIYFTTEILEKHDIEDIIIVTSNYHQRRTLLTAQHLWENHNPPIKIQTVGAIGNYFDSNYWWKNEDQRYFVLSEWGKILYSMVTGKYYKTTPITWIPKI